VVLVVVEVQLVATTKAELKGGLLLLAAEVGAHVVALVVVVATETAAQQSAKQQAIHYRIAEQSTEVRDDYEMVLRISRV
jgi:hypothetical protein